MCHRTIALTDWRCMLPAHSTLRLLAEICLQYSKGATGGSQRRRTPDKTVSEWKWNLVSILFVRKQRHLATEWKQRHFVYTASAGTSVAQASSEDCQDTCASGEASKVKTWYQAQMWRGFLALIFRLFHRKQTKAARRGISSTFLILFWFIYQGIRLLTECFVRLFEINKRKASAANSTFIKSCACNSRRSLMCWAKIQEHIWSSICNNAKTTLAVKPFPTFSSLSCSPVPKLRFCARTWNLCDSGFKISRRVPHIPPWLNL